MELTLRNATIADLKEMQQLYIETIESVCQNDYNTGQIEVWISGVTNTERWIEVIQNQIVLVAVKQDKILGFGTLKEGNYVDLLYIHKDQQRQGIANKILASLELEAQKQQTKTLTADVSITAKPFFEKRGFIVKAEQKNIRLGVELINYKMEKEF
jgi:putative acetyltransferase